MKVLLTVVKEELVRTAGTHIVVSTGGTGHVTR